MKAIELFDTNFTRAENILEEHRAKFPVGRPRTDDIAADDLLRSVVVMAVASLDAYVSMRIIQVLSRVLREERKISKEALSLIKPGTNEQNFRHFMTSIALSTEPWRKIIKEIRTSLANRTFQKPSSIEEAFKIMGIDQMPWSDLDRSIATNHRGRRPTRPPSAKTFLQELADRRDLIVHQGDVYVSPKHHGMLKPISRTAVDKYLKNLRKIVLTIERLTDL